MSKKSLFLSGLVLILFLVLNISCEDTLTDVGNKLLPGEDGMDFKIDTVESIRFKTVPASPYVTMNNEFPFLGHIRDGYFGETKCVLVTQFNFYYDYTATNQLDSRNNYDFPEGAILNSANLKLYFANYFGDTASLEETEMEFNVYGLTNENKPGFGAPDSTFLSSLNYTDYFDSSKVGYLKTKISDFEYDTVNERYYIKIPIGEDYYNKLRKLQDELVDQNWVDTTNSNGDTLRGYDYVEINNDFLRSVAGLAIHCNIMNSTETGGAIFNVITYRDYSQLEVNFTYNDTTDEKFLYTIGLNDAWSPYYPREMNNYTMIGYNYEDYPVNNFINIESDSLCFIQSLGGLNTEVVIPELGSLYNDSDKLIVNKAILSIDREKGFKTLYDKYSPAYLWASAEDNYITDYSNSYFGNNKFTGMIDDDQYFLHVPHIIQNILQGDKDIKFLIFPGRYYSPDGSTNTNNSYMRYNKFTYQYQTLDPKTAKLIITYAIP